MDARALLGVVRTPLMRVLAVAEVGHLGEGHHQHLGKRLDIPEPARDRRLVRRCRRERLRGQIATRGEREGAGLAKLREDCGVAVVPAHGGAVREILRRSAQHRRTADVDHFDGFFLTDSVASGDLAERIEVDADEVERLDLLLL